MQNVQEDGEPLTAMGAGPPWAAMGAEPRQEAYPQGGENHGMAASSWGVVASEPTQPAPPMDAMVAHLGYLLDEVRVMREENRQLVARQDLLEERVMYLEQRSIAWQ